MLVEESTESASLLKGPTPQRVLLGAMLSILSNLSLFGRKEVLSIILRLLESERRMIAEKVDDLFEIFVLSPEPLTDGALITIFANFISHNDVKLDYQLTELYNFIAIIPGYLECPTPFFLRRLDIILCHLLGTAADILSKIKDFILN